MLPPVVISDSKTAWKM